MARIKRFEEFRFVGARDTMLFYDTDDPEQADALAARIAQDALADRTLLQTFAPDDPAEARNRGFSPAG
jgi:hypothetical protein